MSAASLTKIQQFVNLVGVDNSPSMKSDYADPFYSHLYNLLQFDILSGHHSLKDTTKFGWIEYECLEQFIFDNTILVEKSAPLEVDWNLLDDARDILKQKIQQLLGNEGKSDFLKPIVRFTLDSYSNLLMYQMLHPNSCLNPWKPIDEILKKGYIFIASDNKDLLKEYHPKINEKTEKDYPNNLEFVAKKQNEKKFKGFVVDNRLSKQHLVYDYLNDYAGGFSAAKSIKQILKYFEGIGKKITDAELKAAILLPLKRAGIIGSSTKGYYFIKTPSDLETSYDFHNNKMESLQKTLAIYKTKAKEMGFELK